MKILKVNDETYRVFGDALNISDKLMPGVYSVDYDNMSKTFSLRTHSPLTVTEKLYGKHEEKINKLVKAYEKFDRSMGVIFSGDKGIGKSIASRMLCEKMVAKGLPIIMVGDDYPGIADFIDSIQQECVVIFDEFEKNFRIEEQRCHDADESSAGDGGAQDKLLSLFDGTSSAIKRLYLITCNDIWQLSDFLVNRPGRFHYHIRWQYPTADEVREYLTDKVKPQYHTQIDKTVLFAMRANLNYDCLRAIAFELNMGLSFDDAIGDLNIKNLGDKKFFNTEVIFKDGSTFVRKDVMIDIFSNSTDEVYIAERDASDFDDEHRCVVIYFKPAEAIYKHNYFEVNPRTIQIKIHNAKNKKNLVKENIKSIRLYPVLDAIDMGFFRTSQKVM